MFLKTFLFFNDFDLKKTNRNAYFFIEKKVLFFSFCNHKMSWVSLLKGMFFLKKEYHRFYFLRFYLLILFLSLFCPPIYSRQVEAYPPSLFSQPQAEAQYWHFFKVHHLDPSACKVAIQELFPQSKVTIKSQHQLLMVRCSRSEFNTIKKTIEKMDIPIKNIKIQVQILEMTLDQNEANPAFIVQDLNQRLSIDLNTGKYSGLQLKIDELIFEGKLKLMSKPTLLTQDYKEAKFKVGDQWPYTTTISNDKSLSSQLHHLDTGIDITFLPKITSQNRIQLQLSGHINSVKLWRQFEGNEYPVLSSRFIQTELLIKDKEPVILAGLFQENEKENKEKYSYLSKIPLIGRFFERTRKEKNVSDIVIIITPDIVL